MAKGAIMSKLAPTLRTYSSDAQAAVFWGVAATTTGLWIVQPFGWIKKIFFEKVESEQV